MDSASPLMRDFLFQWLHDMSKKKKKLFQSSAKEESSFLRNKAAQVFSLVFIVDFPQRWQSFLVDFLQTLKLGPKAVDFYLRVLKAIDSEVVDREVPHSKEEAARNALIKDRIRETCINDLVNSWYEICRKDDHYSNVFENSAKANNYPLMRITVKELAQMNFISKIVYKTLKFHGG
ncbi:exportin-T-like [Artemia franciscana]|uniref:exportin-T-like n=1 Tax=Artemia franciscana TaxID=6661 RepID=UPI0032DB4E2C